MHSQEQREEICGTFQNSPIWHAALLGTAFSGTGPPVDFSLYFHLIQVSELFWSLRKEVKIKRSDDAERALNWAERVFNPNSNKKRKSENSFLHKFR